MPDPVSGDVLTGEHFEISPEFEYVDPRDMAKAKRRKAGRLYRQAIKLEREAERLRDQSNWLNREARHLDRTLDEQEKGW